MESILLLLFPAGHQMNSPNILIEYFSKILFNNDQTPTNTPSMQSLPSTCSKWGLHSLIISLILSLNPTHLLLMKLIILIRIKMLKALDIKFLLPSSQFISLASRYFLILSIIFSSTD